MKKMVVSKDIGSVIFTLRGQRVIFDADLAILYGVLTKRLNEQVKRNIERFPEEFMFQLTKKEVEALRSQNATSSFHGGSRYLPHVFTEHGALMAANVLNSPQAIAMSIAIVKAFVRLRQMALSMEELTKKVTALEKGFSQHGDQLEAVFDAIRQLMMPPDPPSKKIGFSQNSDF